MKNMFNIILTGKIITSELSSRGTSFAFIANFSHLCC